MTDQIAHLYVLGVVLALLGCSALLAMLFHLDTAAFLNRRKAWLLRRLAGTRLHAVLIRRGVVPAQYVARTDAAALALHIDRCRSCAQPQQCDRTINDSSGDPPIVQCPNRAEILGAADSGQVSRSGSHRN